MSPQNYKDPPNSWVVWDWSIVYCPFCVHEKGYKYKLKWDGNDINSVYTCCKCKEEFLHWGNMLILNRARGGDEMGNKDVWGKFYMCVTEGGNAPNKRHETMDAATKEAERLCRQEECEVAILTVTDICTPERPPIKWTQPK